MTPIVNIFSRWLKRAHVSHKSGAWGNTHTCKSTISEQINRLCENDSDNNQWLQGIIPDLIINAPYLEQLGNKFSLSLQFAWLIPPFCAPHNPAFCTMIHPLPLLHIPLSVVPPCRCPSAHSFPVCSLPPAGADERPEPTPGPFFPRGPPQGWVFDESTNALWTPLPSGISGRWHQVRSTQSRHPWPSVHPFRSARTR